MNLSLDHERGSEKGLPLHRITREPLFLAFVLCDQALRHERFSRAERPRPGCRRHTPLCERGRIPGRHCDPSTVAITDPAVRSPLSSSRVPFFRVACMICTLVLHPFQLLFSVISMV